jgi:hypothetical protein
MQRLIFSLVATVTVLMPHASLAQHRFGGKYYQNDYLQNQGGGDTVIYYNGPYTGGQVLTNNLTPNIDTCDWVREAARLPCKYFGHKRNSTGYTTHFVGTPQNNGDYQLQNSGLNNNYHLQHTPSWNNRGCVYQNNHVRILCN